MVTIDVLRIVLSAFDTAVIDTIEPDGVWTGAAYTPADVIVPTFKSPPAIPLTSHATESLVVLATDAVNVCVLPASTLLDPGHTASSTFGVLTVHDFSVAAAGAADAMEVGLRITFAVSTRPTSSVTATWSVAYPQEGAVTVAAALVAF
jgi:hypothetical protein